MKTKEQAMADYEVKRRARVRQSLLEAGVRNLKEFGYPDVTVENILTVDVFKRFFKSMLEDNVGKGGALQNEEMEKLLKEIA